MITYRLCGCIERRLRHALGHELLTDVSLEADLDASGGDRRHRGRHRHFTPRQSRSRVYLVRKARYDLDRRRFELTRRYIHLLYV